MSEPVSPGGALRALASTLFSSSISAVDPEVLVFDYLADAALPQGAPVHVVAIGKAAGAMARGAVRAFEKTGHRVASGLVILPSGQQVKLPEDWSVFHGGHPLPSEEGALGAKAALERARNLTDKDRLLCLVSGGGSALASLPADGLSLDDLRKFNRLALRSGAPIDQVNTLRKHFDAFSGGRLAAAAYPARVLTLVLSDVVGNRVDTIASGPTTPDPTTFADSLDLVDRLALAPELPEALARHLERGVQGDVAESPNGEHPCFAADPESHTARCETVLVGSNRLACDTLADAARGAGYEPHILSTSVTGEARELGTFLAAIAREVSHHHHPVAPPCCLITAGETTVSVTGQGRGGRNQEVVLGAVDGLAGLENCLVASCGTDGVDGPTDAAGAWADGKTALRARTRKMNPAAHLANNDSYPFFEALDDLIRLGPTGTNVMDIQLVLIGAAPSEES